MGGGGRDEYELGGSAETDPPTADVTYEIPSPPSHQPSPPISLPPISLPPISHPPISLFPPYHYLWPLGLWALPVEEGKSVCMTSFQSIDHVTCYNELSSVIGVHSSDCGLYEIVHFRLFSFSAGKVRLYSELTGPYAR